MQNKTKYDVPRTDDGQVGIRASLKNMGYSDADIGYDNASGTVMLKGKALMKPGYLDEDAGVSYASESNIQKSLVDYYSGSQNPVVRVSDAFAGYAGKYGLGADALGYGNGSVTLGGKPIDIMYIDKDGKAWARQSAVTSAADDYIAQNKLSTPTDINDKYADLYLDKAEDILSQLEKYEDFEYNPDSDPVFQAYKKMYMTEAERAAEDSMAEYSALTGGYVNSAAATAGALAEQYYAKKLTDAIPELAAAAYERYADGYNRRLNAANLLTEMYNAAYNNAQSANTLLRDNINYSAAADTSRNNAAYEKAAAEDAASREALLSEQEYESRERDEYWNELFNTQKLLKNEYTNDGLRLNNEEKEIYGKYYEKLLRTELSGAELDNALISAKLMYGKF